VISVLDEYNELGCMVFSSLDDVQECTLIELIVGDVSEPDVEPAGGLV